MGWLLVVFFVIFIIALLHEKAEDKSEEKLIIMDIVQSAENLCQPFMTNGEIHSALGVPIVAIELQTDILVVRYCVTEKKTSN